MKVSLSSIGATLVRQNKLDRDLSPSRSSSSQDAPGWNMVKNKCQVSSKDAMYQSGSHSLEKKIYA